MCQFYGPTVEIKTMNKLSIVLITDVEFWRLAAGHQVRIERVIRDLACRVDLTVVYIGALAHEVGHEVSSNFGIELVLLSGNKLYSQATYLKKLRQLVSSRPFDACIVEYIHNTIFLKVFDYPILKILDAHDVAWQKYLSFSSIGMEDYTIYIDKGYESRILRKYDIVLAICDKDAEAFREMIPPDRVYVLPHISKKVGGSFYCSDSAVGFVGSEYIPNVICLNEFISKIWQPFNVDRKWRLLIAGNVGEVLREYLEADDSIEICGFVEDLAEFYRSVSCIVNPVYIGSGLKIKSVEALAYGKSVISRSHSARGLEQYIGKRIFVYDDIESFRSCMENVDLRVDLLEEKVAELKGESIDSILDVIRVLIDV